MRLLSDFKGDSLEKPVTKKPTSTETKREKLALLRRSKRSEREFARWMVEHDGPDSSLRGLTTSTGRIGHVTAIRADTLSSSFIGENKNEKLNATMGKYWQLICQKAIEFRKSPILHLEPSNAKSYPVNGKPLPDLYIIDGPTLAHLLDCRRRVDSES